MAYSTDDSTGSLGRTVPTDAFAALGRLFIPALNVHIQHLHARNNRHATASSSTYSYRGADFSGVRHHASLGNKSSKRAYTKTLTSSAHDREVPVIRHCQHESKPWFFVRWASTLWRMRRVHGCLLAISPTAKAPKYLCIPRQCGKSLLGGYLCRV